MTEVPLLDTLASYVPALTLRRMAEEAAPLTEPHHEQFEAAVLFADISGFTALAERLAQHGSGGAEELTALLNVYFGQLIDLITQHGGDVVKFAGDALLALWSVPLAPGAELPSLTLRAAQCALAAQRALNQFEVTPGVHLSLRIGVSAGEFTALHLGGVYGRWETLFRGEPLVEVGIANQQATPGEVVLSPTAWAHIAPQAVGAPLGAGLVRLDSLAISLPPMPLAIPLLAPSAESALRAYIPGAILARLAAGHVGWLAELRHITVLFLNLPSLNEASVEEAQQVMRALQGALYRYEGSINKISLDEKGATLVAALGLPPFSHEDDALRGVQAALEMLRALESLGMSGAIGIATGQVFCGSVGNRRRREYTMIGDVVNLAARLMQAAQGGAGALCDEATYEGARAHIAFERRDPIKVKGKAVPIALFRPLNDKGPMLPRRPEGARGTMVGRRSERTRLAEELQGVLRGGGGTMLIEGEAGIGKSRLLADLVEQADALGLTVLLGAGDAVEKSTLYHGWRALFRALFAWETLPEEPELRREALLAQVKRRLGEGFLPLVPLLSAVLPIELPESELTAQMAGHARADNIREFLLALLKAESQTRPLVLVLEDAHWLDSASWSLALAVSQRQYAEGQRLLLVLAMRPLAEPVPFDYLQIRRSPLIRHIALETLSPEESIALVCHRLGVEALPEAVGRLLMEKAEGHPFFSEELAYALRDAGVLLIEAGQATLSPQAGDLSALNFPASIQGVITSRIDRLDPTLQLALKVASVIGRVFTVHTLDHVYPIETERDRLLDSLKALERLDLTPLESLEPVPTYLFKHIITQEVAYNLMLFTQRRTLHRAVAEWYERTYENDLAPFYALLAHHWSRAEEPARAIHYLDQAAQQALYSGAHQEVVRFLREALALAESNPALDISSLTRARWERQMGQASYGLGHLSESLQHLQQALVLLGRPMPSRTTILLLHTLGHFLLQFLRRLLPRSQRIVAKDEARTEAALALEQMAQLYYLANKILSGCYATVTSLNVAEPNGPSPELARSYAQMGIAAGVLGLPWLAHAYNRWALRLAYSLGNPMALARVNLFGALYEINSARWPRAQAMAEEAHRLYVRLGDQRAQGDTMIMMGFLAYFQGQFERCREIYESLDVLGTRLDQFEHKGRGLNGQGMSLLALGRTEEALAKLEAADPLLDEQTTRLGRWLNDGTRAVALLRLGRTEEALQTADDLNARLLTNLPVAFGLYDAYGSVADVYLTLWERGRWSERQARHACRALEDFARQYVMGKPRSWRYWGRYHWLKERPHLAQRAWLKSLALAEELAMPYEVALAHYELGRHATDEARHIHLARAEEFFTALDAAYDLERVRTDERKSGGSGGAEG